MMGNSSGGQVGHGDEPPPLGGMCSSVPCPQRGTCPVVGVAGWRPPKPMATTTPSAAFGSWGCWSCRGRVARGPCWATRASDCLGRALISPFSYQMCQCQQTRSCPARVAGGRRNVGALLMTRELGGGWCPSAGFGLSNESRFGVRRAQGASALRGNGLKKKGLERALKSCWQSAVCSTPRLSSGRGGGQRAPHVHPVCTPMHTHPLRAPPRVGSPPPGSIWTLSASTGG